MLPRMERHRAGMWSEPLPIRSTSTRRTTCAARPGCHNDYRIASLDPATMQAQVQPHPETRPHFGDATAAVRVGGEVWIGSNPATRVAVLGLAK